ncbi:MAG TPA: MbtH family NRPS accessory protein [Candidatus Angelobacter sp.]|jgi:uncharacterized protein YbdZ (MbtH family)|nr:MbtH family NRPS accessory protein [Candidatus Angelobacter sp.]
MIEQAYVSGQLGKAVYIDDAGEYFVCASDAPEPVPCRWGDIQTLLNSGAEFKDLGKKLQLEGIRDVLQFEERAHTALFLFLAGFDKNLEDSVRSRASNAAGNMLEDVYVARFVRNRLLSRPAPINFLVREAKILPAKTALLQLIRQVTVAQAAINWVSQAWDKVAREEFKFSHEALRVQQFLTDEGFFGYVVDELCSLKAVFPETERVGTLVRVYRSDVKLRKLCPQIAQILKSFMNQLVFLTPQKGVKSTRKDALSKEVLYKVVINDEGRGSIWPIHQRIVPSWREIGRSGTFAECLGCFLRVDREEIQAWQDPQSSRLPEYGASLDLTVVGSPSGRTKQGYIASRHK